MREGEGRAVKIEIFGTGCAKCTKLFENAQEAVRLSGADASVAKVDDIEQILNAGVMLTPALAVDGNIKCSGNVLSIEEIQRLLV